MSNGQMALDRAFAEREIAIAKGRKVNLRHPEVPNRTKVVRLFVVPSCLNPESSREVAEYVRGKNPTREDVFVVTKRGRLRPTTWHGSKLLDHAKAHGLHIDTAVVLKGIDREQIEWQCDVPFRITKIEKVTRHIHGFHSFPSVADNPPNPFASDLRKLAGSPCVAIRSGPTAVIRRRGTLIEWKQLYKAHFALYINGVWKPLDPDVYCEWR
jgi:hypothetical protein